MSKVKILWADDEIDLLKPHILFLEDKGYEVFSVKSGDAALELLEEKKVDIVFLDENMPGISGIETLSQIKAKYSSLPVIMITKSEEESIMEDAIGSKISDYLIKPVNPKQILLSIKKNLDEKRLVSEKTTTDYQQEFRKIGMEINDNLDSNQWIDVYKKIVHWDMEIANSKESGMKEVLDMQKSEANRQFSRFIENNYTNWLHNADEAPVMSHTLMKKKISPFIKDHQPVYFILIDNLRYDHWKAIRPIISDYFWVEKEEAYYSILPTTTQYARNSIFAGLLPSEIEKKYPNAWLNDDEKGGKNMHEKEFLEAQLKRFGENLKFSYYKVLNPNFGRKVLDDIPNLQRNDLNVIVYNFIDMLSHARTDVDIVRELAEDEAAYRSLTISWFEHSPLFEILKKIAAQKAKVIISTDHGSVRVMEPTKIVGDKEVNPNLRYKQGKTLSYDSKEVFEIKNPADAFLPKINVSQTYVFAKEDKYFVYPNNYNHFVQYYKETFQHGGISMEEMIIPFVELTAK
jgi:CheY-like chemotaxis protein